MEVSCPICASLLSRPPNRVHANRGTYCSRECAYKGIHLTRTKEVECSYCKKAFRVDTKAQRVFCSNQCRLANQANPLTSFRCVTCDKQCLYSDYNFDRRRIVCSRGCYRIWACQFRCGSKSHFWRGGLTNTNDILRGQARTNEWRTKVFSRDDYTCQACGARNGNGKEVYLEAHHIKAWSQFPSLRWDVNNGITLCRYCHRKTDNYGRQR